MRDIQVQHANVLRAVSRAESDIDSVRKHLAAHEVVLPLFDGMHQGKHLAFMCGVVALRGVPLPAGTPHQADMSAAVRLRQGGAERVRAGVKVESEWW